MTQMERNLLSHGTLSGPVDPEMIACAKTTYKITRRLGHEVEDGWTAWIGLARKRFMEACPAGCIRPFNDESGAVTVNNEKPT